MLIDPESHALLDSTGRQLAGQVLPSPPKATEVVGFVQTYVPAPEISSLAHTSRPAIAAFPPHTAGPASAGLASAGPASARPASKQGPEQARVAYSCLLEDFLALVCASKRLPPISHDIVHHIVTHGPPIKSYRNWTARSWRQQRQDLNNWRRRTLFCVPILPGPAHMVRKADGSWRPCGDFRRLNPVTDPDVYPLPNMLDFPAKSARSTVFSQIDLWKGYHQIPINPDDVQQTTITTPFGLFEYKRMTFGLRNAGPSFQHHVDRAFWDFAWVEATFAWVDDIIICSRNHAEHIAHVRQLLQALQDNGLVIHAKKCVRGS
jgi:hypothetical protein